MEKIFAELEIMLYLRSYSVSNHQKTNIISLTTANDALIKIKYNKVVTNKAIAAL